MSRTSSVLFIDSPIIYGDRVETSKPYHLIYIDNPYLHLMLTLYTLPPLPSAATYRATAAGVTVVMDCPMAT